METGKTGRSKFVGWGQVFSFRHTVFKEMSGRQVGIQVWNSEKSRLEIQIWESLGYVKLWSRCDRLRNVCRQSKEI